VPRPSKKKQPVVSTTALVASAHRYTGKAPRIFVPSKEWQKRAYHHFGHNPEAHYAATYYAQAISRAELYCEDPREGRQEGSEAQAALDELFGGPEGQAGTLHDIGLHLTIGGECYLIGRTVNGADIWEVLSVLEVESDATGWRMMSAEANVWIPLGDNDVVIRIWTPKAGNRWEADSSFRSSLPVLDEIEFLTRYIHAQTVSRLTGNGILFLPDGMSFPPPPAKEGEEVETLNEADAFMRTLGAVTMESLKGDGSPSEMVPIIVTADGEAIGNVKHVTFWTPLDEHAQALRQDARHRFALGMNLPPEMIEGMSSNEGTGGGSSNGVSHWGAWMIEEQTIKLHIEPMLDVIVGNLKTYYLDPAIENNTERIAYSTSRLKLRPDRSKESMELWRAGKLKGDRMLAENGFDPEHDSMDEAERKEWLLMKIASGSATPEQVQAALILLGVDLKIPLAAEQGEPRETRPDPSLEDHPTRPRTPAERIGASYGVEEGLVLRALERAGNRLRNITQTRTIGASWEAHTKIQANGSTADCLQDAFGTATLQLGSSRAATVVPVLTEFCTQLFETGQPYSYEALAAWCEEAGI
jgi:hypothetical protein